MDKINKDTFIAWITGCNWFMINDIATQVGQQCHYVTPAGEVVIAQFDVNKNLSGFTKLPPPMPPTMPHGFPGLDPLGGQRLRP